MLSYYTTQAAYKFRQLVRAERKVEKLRKELDDLASKVPAEEMKSYLEYTSRIEQEQ